MQPQESYARSHAPAPIRRLARRLLRWRYRNFEPHSQPEKLVRVAGLRLRVLPDVFSPAIHFTSGVFARFLSQPSVVPRGGDVLDLGTGSGLLAIAAARSGARRVVALDISPAAVGCARSNVARYGIQSVVEVREGDSFGPLEGERFDLVVCNPPYFRGEPKSLAERAFLGGLHLEWFTKFGRDMHNYLNTSGHALISLGDAAEIDTILRLLRECGWRIEQVARRDILVEIIYLFKSTPNVEKTT
ncbi:MAG: methyltransferase [Chloroflexota bacterium]